MRYRISSFANNVAAMAIPSVFIFISALFNGSTIELHHGLLGLFLSRYVALDLFHLSGLKTVNIDKGAMSVYHRVPKKSCW